MPISDGMTETIAQFIRSGDAMYVQCGSCDHYERLDMEMLRKRECRKEERW